jgi:hypothetical protein
MALSPVRLTDVEALLARLRDDPRQMRLMTQVLRRYLKADVRPPDDQTAALLARCQQHVEALDNDLLDLLRLTLPHDPRFERGPDLREAL